MDKLHKGIITGIYYLKICCLVVTCFIPYVVTCSPTCTKYPTHESSVHDYHVYFRRTKIQK